MQDPSPGTRLIRFSKQRKKEPLKAIRAARRHKGGGIIKKTQQKLIYEDQVPRTP